MPSPDLLDRHFPRYTANPTRVPVWCLTPQTPGCFHRFFMSNPLSPSGRFLAALRLFQEKTFPAPGEQAEVLVIDLETGEQRPLAKTAGWEPQMGANLNWGPDDHTLYWNDVDQETWCPVTIRCDLSSGTTEAFGRGLYHISPDGALLACTSLETMRRTQRGYGVVIPDDQVPLHQGFPEDDGLWITDTRTRECRLILSLSTILSRLGPEGLQIPDAEQGHAYGFHTQFNADGSRLMFTLRWIRPGHPRPWDNIGADLRFVILTCKPDGTDLHAAVPASYWEHGGHHTRWMPDGEHLSMNLIWPELGTDHMTLVKAQYDGSRIAPILDHPHGSGHPTVHPGGNILTDTYTWEGPRFGATEGSSLIRWINVQEQSETSLVEIPTAQPSGDKALRVDPHVAFDAGWRFATFNGFTNGTRRVFLADLSEFVAG